MAMITNRFKITLKGDEADESLRLSDLIAQLDSIKKVLNELDKRVSGKPAASLYYRVVGLSMNSPAMIEIEAVLKATKASATVVKSRHASVVINRLKRDIKDVNKGKRPPDADIELLETYKSLSHPQKSHITQFRFESNSTAVDVPRSFEEKVDAILGLDHKERGSLVGSLEVIDIHNQRNIFRVFPTLGPSSIRCKFPAALLSKAVDGIGHFVRISGDLHFKSSEKFPHFMTVTKIEKLPEKPSDVSLSALRGMAKGAFGNLAAADYVDKLRNGDW